MGTQVAQFQNNPGRNNDVVEDWWYKWVGLQKVPCLFPDLSMIPQEIEIAFNLAKHQLVLHNNEHDLRRLGHLDNEDI